MFSILGNANSVVTGFIRWTNSLTGGSGSVAASGIWSVPNIPLGQGTNVITVTGSNIVEQSASDTVQINRVIPPEVDITVPAGNIAVLDTVTDYVLQGNANHVVTGAMRWTNGLTGGSGTFAASQSWSSPSIPLAQGVNTITVSGTNIVDQADADSVQINRVIPPQIDITSPATDIVVGNATATYNLGGTANHVVAGFMRWTNALTGASGSIPAATGWSIPGIVLSPGVNPITVSGTNIVEQPADDSVVIRREGTILLNEVLVNPVGTDDQDDLEYLELRNANGPMSLAGVSVLVIDGNGANTGQVRERWDLDALMFGNNNLLLLGNNYDDDPVGGPWADIVSYYTEHGDPTGFARGDLPNGTVTFLLVDNCLPGIVQGVDLDANDDGQLDSAPWVELLDSVGWSDGGVGDLVYSPAVLTQSSGVPDAATRFPDVLVPEDTQAWYNGDIMATASETLGRTYDGVNISDNWPTGALLTPGRHNYPVPGDIDADGLPDWWESLHFGGPTNAVPSGDPDIDTLDNLGEYWANTDPHDGDSSLAIVEATPYGTNYLAHEFLWTNGSVHVVTQWIMQADSIVVDWPAATNGFYLLEGRTGLTPATPFQTIQDWIQGTPPMNVYTDAFSGSETRSYRVTIYPPLE